jgi:exosortase A
MPPDSLGLDAPLAGQQPNAWTHALVRLALAAMLIIELTAADWREMAHQWWDIDTYAHILLIPPIIAWLAWLRRPELERIAPVAWAPGLIILLIGLAIWLVGREAGVNLASQAGAVIALQGIVAALLGARATLVLAFPLFYAFFLVPFGDEIIPALQDVTARIAVALTHASGVQATVHGLFIDTPAGRFIIAEECAGVKFLVAMTAIATLVAWTGFRSWQRRALLLVGAAATSIIANGVRAWGTIFAAQYVGAERAGGIDHIVYGWLFFAVVIALVLAVAWRFFERDPGEAGFTADEAGALAAAIGGRDVAAAHALIAIAALAIVFAVVERVV